MKKDRFGNEDFNLNEIGRPPTAWDIAAQRVLHRELEEHGYLQEDYLERIRDEVKIVKREQAKAERLELFRQCLKEVRSSAGNNPNIEWGLIEPTRDLMKKKHGVGIGSRTAWTYYGELFPEDS